MSWDVMIMNFAEPVEAMEAMSDDSKMVPLGTIEEVHALVLKHFPGTDWSDPSWGQFESPFGSIEFNIGEDDPASSIMLHIRASDEILTPILALCEEQDFQALDCSTGEFLDQAEDPTAGLNAWRSYRDKIAGDE